ncbi:MAG: hypothetical protein ABI888_01515 [Chloroflexota bacterium]
MSGEPTQDPSSAPRQDRSIAYAITISIVLIAVAVAGAAGVARSARTATTPSPSPTPFIRPSPTLPPDTGPLVFTQPLTAGCVAGDAVYVVSDGGGIGRFAFDRWQLVDPIARSLAAATCRGDVLTAVGGGGRVVTINDRDQTIRADSVLFDDFQGVAPLGDGVIAVGRSGTIQRQVAAGWGTYASGIEEDLYAVAAFGPTSAWTVGAGGVSYRLEAAGWRPIATGVTGTLRAIAARAVDDLIVVGDSGAVLRWAAGRWVPVPGAPNVTLRAALNVDRTTTYVGGDNGTLLRLTAAPDRLDAAIVDLGTTCTLRALFARGEEVWVIGSDGAHAAVWRITGNTVFHWGRCP